MNENSYRELRRNTIIIAISNFGSKAISYVLAPLYSYFLTTSEYGSMDLVTTTVNLLLPLICLDIYEGTFRFSEEKKYRDGVVISTSLSVCIYSTILFGIIIGVINFVHKLPLIVNISVFVALLTSYQNVLAQFARGSGKLYDFAFSGVLNSIILLCSNILFMFILKMGLTGWLISYVIAKIIVVIYLFIRLQIYERFSIKKFNKQCIIEILKYCLPLIPSASMWWIMNASDRYMISFFVGVSATGIYAVGAKLPSLLSIFENVFYQSWQTTAINTADNEKKDNLYSEIFEKYFHFLILGTVFLLLILKPLIFIFFAEEYHTAWICSALLVIGVVIHALAGNIGTIYTVSKDTVGAFKTCFWGALANLILNFIFIPSFGLNAAAVTTIVSYIIVLIARWFDTKKFVKIKLHLNTTLFYIIVLLCQLLLYFIPGILSYIIRFVIAFWMLFINRDLVLGLLKFRD